ncbi:hypothetical protein CR513_62454, partial [Mucuna pruriens]
MQCPKNDLEQKEMKFIPYASVVGSLMYAQTCTRSNISFFVVMLDYGGCMDLRKSTFEYIFLLARGIVSWKSAKQFVIATSTIKVEFVACFEATIQALPYPKGIGHSLTRALSLTRFHLGVHPRVWEWTHAKRDLICFKQRVSSKALTSLHSPKPECQVISAQAENIPASPALP